METVPLPAQTLLSANFAESLAVLRGALTEAAQCAVACWDLPGCGKTGGPPISPDGGARYGEMPARRALDEQPCVLASD